MTERLGNAQTSLNLPLLQLAELAKTLRVTRKWRALLVAMRKHVERRKMEGEMTTQPCQFLEGKGWERKRNFINFFEKEQVERGVSSTTLSTSLGESS